MSRFGQATNNKWYQLAVGLIMGALGISSNEQVKDYNKCFPAEFQSSNVDDAASTQKNWGWVTTILNGIGVLIKAMCKIKDKVAGLFSSKFSLVEASDRIVNSKNTGQAGKNLLGKVGKGVVDAGKKGVAAGKKAVDEAKAGIGEKFAKLFKPMLNDIKRKIISLLPQTFQNFLNKFLSCGGASKATEVFKNSVTLIKGIVNKVHLIARVAGNDPVAIAQLILGIVCNYPLFKQGWDHFKTAWNQSSIPTKYNYYGRAFGVWFKAVAAKRLAIRRRRLNKLY